MSKIPERCKSHNKKIKVLCLSCLERICYKCGMFGSHKGHDFQQEREFYHRVESFRNKIQKKLGKIAEMELLLQESLLANLFERQSQSKKKRLMAEVDEFFEQVILNLQVKKKEFSSLIE